MACAQCAGHLSGLHYFITVTTHELYQNHLLCIFVYHLSVFINLSLFNYITKCLWEARLFCFYSGLLSFSSGLLDTFLNVSYLLCSIQMLQLVFAHDTVRVIQCCVKYGTEDQRKAIFEEIRGMIYACYLLYPITPNKYPSQKLHPVPRQVIVFKL